MPSGAYGAGLRLGECTRLQAGDLDLQAGDLEAGEITVRSDGRRPARRAVLPRPLHEPLRRHLDAQRLRLPPPGGLGQTLWVFPAPARAGDAGAPRPVSDDTIQRAVRRAA